MLTGIVGVVLAAGLLLGSGPGRFGPWEVGSGRTNARGAAIPSGRSHDGSAIGSATAAATKSGRRSDVTVYIARTPEEAQTLRDWFARGSAGTQSSAAAPPSAVIAPSADEAAFARGAIMNWLTADGEAPAMVDAHTIQGSRP